MSVSFGSADNRDFHGAKFALFIGPRLVTLLRDDKPDIPWPAYWDFPGGGREGTETGLECALRETREELGLIVPPDAVTWGRLYWRKGLPFWFFAGHLPAKTEHDIVFGNEGQCWELVNPTDYLTREKAIPQFQSRLADYLAGLPSE